MLGQKTMEDPHFQKMLGWAEKDLNIHSMDEAKAKLEKIGRQLMKRAQHCPVTQRLIKQVRRLHRLINKYKKVSDLPKEREMRRWWREHRFQPWE